jgi:hypothetical protein
MAEESKASSASSSLQLLSVFIPSSDQIKLVQGIEGDLLRRRRGSTLASAIAVIGGGLVQILAAQKGSLTSGYAIAGLAVLLIGATSYLIFRHTSFLLQASNEPFRYTFWVAPFELVKDTPGTRFSLKENDRLLLLDNDLREKLNRQIGRLSLLNVDEANSGANPEALGSHIRVSGTYVIREDSPGEWVIQVMPRIRIGGPNRPETLAYTVKYPLEFAPVKPDAAEAGAAKDSPQYQDCLDADKYNQLMNRVYSSVATEIYKQIFGDVEGKVKLFPTTYRRSRAIQRSAGLRALQHCGRLRLRNRALPAVQAPF